jgi:hypothetical protein
MSSSFPTRYVPCYTHNIVVNGPITTAQISAGSITASQIAVGTIPSSQLIFPIDLSLVSSEDLMKEVLRRGAFNTIKEYKGKK